MIKEEETQRNSDQVEAVWCRAASRLQGKQRRCLRVTGFTGDGMRALKQQRRKYDFLPQEMQSEARRARGGGGACR